MLKNNEIASEKLFNILKEIKRLENIQAGFIAQKKQLVVLRHSARLLIQELCNI
jgi:hypothetical protein